MYVEVSIGEALDRLSILEIKLAKSRDSVTQQALLDQVRPLRDACAAHAGAAPDEYAQLRKLNEELWDLEDAIRDAIPYFHVLTVAHHARLIVQANDARAVRRLLSFGLLPSNFSPAQTLFAAAVGRQPSAPSTPPWGPAPGR